VSQPPVVAAPRRGWRALVLPSFAGFRPAWLRGDVIAGLTVWAVLVPESLAYAGIAGVPPVVGLYAAVPALLLYALVGSSRHLVVAPMSATAALSIGLVGDMTDDPTTFIAVTSGLAVATGVVAMLAGVLRLGFLASFISEPVLKGFIIGLALTIMIGQVPALLGVEKGSGDFFEKAWSVLRHLPDVDALTVTVGVGSLAVLLALRRWLPVVPASLVVALLGIAAVALLGLDDDGLEIVGTIQSGLPDLGLPDVSGPDFLDLLAGSVGVMLVGFAEGLGAAKTYATKQGYDIDSNSELFGLGLANLGSGLSSGMVVNGSLSKTAVNGSAGARSQLSGVTAAALTLITLLFLTGLFEKLPEATLAAIVIAAVIELVDIASLRRLWRVGAGRLVTISPYTRRADFLGAVTALAGVLLFDTLPGLAIGIGVSLVLLIARTSRPYIAVLGPSPAPEAGGTTRWVDVRRHPETTPVPGILVVRVEAALMFANADFVREQVRSLAAVPPSDGVALHAVILDGEATPAVDVTASDMLTQLRGDLARTGIELVVANGIGQVRDMLRVAGEHGEPPVYPTIDAAVAALATGRGGFTHNG
jgi:SulP family sulfate permease